MQGEQQVPDEVALMGRLFPGVQWEHGVMDGKVFAVRGDIADGVTVSVDRGPDGQWLWRLQAPGQLVIQNQPWVADFAGAAQNLCVLLNRLRQASIARPLAPVRCPACEAVGPGWHKPGCAA